MVKGMIMAQFTPRKENDVEFSVIIPAYNASQFMEKCIHSVLNQEIKKETLEIILVDDCSSDSTFNVASTLAIKHKNLLVTKTEKNSGPGIARNTGLKMAKGKWILFLDSDDHLEENALHYLHDFLSSEENDSLDAVGFNWKFDPQSIHSNQFQTSGRKDHNCLKLNEDDLIKEYLSLHMDGSVIYTATRKEIIDGNKMEFYAGYHEDVDFIFKIYWHARKVGYLDKVLYVKGQHPNSIINTVSPKHIEGFMRAWRDIGDYIAVNDPEKWQEFLPFYHLGLFGVVATRVREIYRYQKSVDQAAELYKELYRCWVHYFGSVEKFAGPPAKKTKYISIASYFLDTMKDKSLPEESKAGSVNKYMAEISPKCWSCIDLHHSLFLAPDQIRTCCKRFFVNGEMRGDVCLIDKAESDNPIVNSVEILQAKQILLAKINSGEESDCDGCPFLEFKDWGPSDKLDITYLSLEYHSVCNLRCTYCSELFYDGKKSRYDVNILMQSLIKNNALDNCKTIVWGGGEPVLDKGFNSLFKKMVVHLPSVRQRVLTNAVKYSKTIERFLKEDKICITSSVDAGTDKTFLLIRGRPKLKEVMSNLKRYSLANASQVTVKYIFTEDNSCIDEVKSFIALIKKYKLTGCNFQISSDFKKESISRNDVISIIAMYGLLYDERCRVIFFDDLLRIRLDEVNANSEKAIKTRIDEMGLTHAIADKSFFKSVAIWGAGWQAKYLIEKTSFFKTVNVEFFVDSTISKIGGQFLGRNIYAPDVLLDSYIPVVIAAVQGFPLIYDAFLALGIDEARLIKKLIL